MPEVDYKLIEHITNPPLVKRWIRRVKGILKGKRMRCWKIKTSLNESNVLPNSDLDFAAFGETVRVIPINALCRLHSMLGSSNTDNTAKEAFSFLLRSQRL